MSLSLGDKAQRVLAILMGLRKRSSRRGACRLAFSDKDIDEEGRF